MSAISRSVARSTVGVSWTDNRLDHRRSRPARCRSARPADRVFLRDNSVRCSLLPYSGGAFVATLHCTRKSVCLQAESPYERSSSGIIDRDHRESAFAPDSVPLFPRAWTLSGTGRPPSTDVVSWSLPWLSSWTAAESNSSPRATRRLHDRSRRARRQAAPLGDTSRMNAGVGRSVAVLNWARSRTSTCRPTP